MTLLAVFSLATVGCQKEPLNESPQSMTTEVATYTVYYTVDGVPHTASFSSKEEWRAFIDRMFALAEEGHSVTFYDNERDSNGVTNKEIVTYITQDKNEAEAWADMMRKNQYVVSISYDTKTGVYTCTAIK